MSIFFENFNKRGVVTSWWCLNVDKEIHDAINSTTVNAIVSDRPKHLKEILIKVKADR